MEYFKRDMKVVVLLAMIISVLVYLIIGILGAVIAFIISSVIMTLCSYLNNDVHSELFGDEMV